MADQFTIQSINPTAKQMVVNFNINGVDYVKDLPFFTDQDADLLTAQLKAFAKELRVEFQQLAAAVQAADQGTVPPASDAVNALTGQALAIDDASVATSDTPSAPADTTTAPADASTSPADTTGTEAPADAGTTPAATDATPAAPDSGTATEVTQPTDAPAPDAAPVANDATSTDPSTDTTEGGQPAV